MYEYRATVTDVYDGDTITVDIDLGFHSHMKFMKLRLYGINAPEVRGPEKITGRITRDWLRREILGQNIIIRTHKDKTGKYGRWLANIYPEHDQSKSYNDLMVEHGLAVVANY